MPIPAGRAEVVLAAADLFDIGHYLVEMEL